MNNLHLIVREQFPEFVREDYPLFVEFVQTYYKWLDTQSVGKLESLISLDKTPERFVEHFKSELDNYGLLTNSIQFNKLYLQRIKQIYAAKGSEQGLINLLKIVHQAETVVRYPSEQILRASDGRWEQESFIVVQQTFGQLPQSFNDFYIDYDLTQVRVKLSKYEIIDEGTVRLFFKPSTKITAVENQLIYIYNSQGSVVYSAKILRQPFRFDIVNGGTNWQLGQIVVMPGGIRDTVARVTEVGEQGEILSIQIIQYGIGHSENQTLIISPYPNKPLNPSFDLTVTQTSVSPPKFLYTLDVRDYLEGPSDRVTGTVSGIFENSYFLQDYVETGYNGYEYFDNWTYPQEYQETVDSDITIEQWLESRATLRYTYGTVVVEPGRWTADSGIISNENIRLQDNFYYQQFSYDIEANVNSNNYIELAKTVHPAGMKLFTTYALGDVLEVEPFAVTSFPFVAIDLFDAFQPLDTNEKVVEKFKTDSASVSDFDKQLVTKRPVDSVTLGDTNKQTIAKRITELLSTSDSNTAEVTKLKEELLTISEATAKTFNKYLIDSSTISSPDTSSLEIVQYNVEGYFGEDYVRTDKILTLGA